MFGSMAKMLFGMAISHSGVPGLNPRPASSHSFLLLCPRGNGSSTSIPTMPMETQDRASVPDFCPRNEDATGQNPL